MSIPAMIRSALHCAPKIGQCSPSEWKVICGKVAGLSRNCGLSPICVTVIKHRDICLSQKHNRMHPQAYKVLVKGGESKSKEINKCFAKLNGAITGAGGERDPKKNPQLAKVIKEFGGVLRKGALANFLASKEKKLVDVTTYLQGPSGLQIVVECSVNGTHIAKQCIKSAANRAKLKLDLISREGGFQSKGIIQVDLPIHEKNLSEDEAESLAIEVGAEDYEIAENYINFYCDKTETNNVSEALVEKNIEPSLVNVELQPVELVSISENLRTLFEAFVNELNQSEEKTSYTVVIKNIVSNIE